MNQSFAFLAIQNDCLSILTDELTNETKKLLMVIEITAPLEIIKKRYKARTLNSVVLLSKNFRRELVLGD